jgi:hypothetical protein
MVQDSMAGPDIVVTTSRGLPPALDQARQVQPQRLSRQRLLVQAGRERLIPHTDSPAATWIRGGRKTCSLLPECAVSCVGPLSPMPCTPRHRTLALLPATLPRDTSMAASIICGHGRPSTVPRVLLGAAIRCSPSRLDGLHQTRYEAGVRWMTVHRQDARTWTDIEAQ